MVKKYQHGFCILRCQPFHIGHNRLIQKMMEECAYGTVLIAAAQECGTSVNPLPYFMRKKMIQNVWRKNESYNRLRIMGIRNKSNIAWDEYVMDSIARELPHLPVPDVMYVGDEREYNLFSARVPNVGICSRTTQDFPFLSGNMVRDMILLNDERWKNFIPIENQDLIKKGFCEFLTV